MKLGLVTYNVARDWDLPTVIDRVSRAGWEGVELRAEHAHGVDGTMDAARRREVRKRLADAGIALWALRSICEFHSPDPAIVAANVEMARRWCDLARDLGARGVKVRPNGLPEGVEPARTLSQIGRALKACGEAADACGVEIFVEVHGPRTQEPENMRALLDHCGHPKVGACWNCNDTDVKEGSVRAAFDLLGRDIRSCHINDLWDESYPYRELFGLLDEAGYDGFTLCEVATPVPPDGAIPFMSCYRGLWRELRRRDHGGGRDERI